MVAKPRLVRDEVLQRLKRFVISLRTRRGPHSNIVRTLEEAIESNDKEDHRRGAIVLDIFLQTGEERSLSDIPRRLNPRVQEPTANPPLKYVWENSFGGVDFSKVDQRSTRKNRHLLARDPKKKLN